MFKSRKAFTLVELLVVIAIIGILIALLLPAVQAARAAARRSHCSNNLKQIGLGFHNYHDVNKHFPSDGDNGSPADSYACCSATVVENYSWTYWILPYIEESNLFDLGSKYGNKGTLNKTPVDTYYCPERRRVGLYKNNAKCDYAGNAGRNSGKQGGGPLLRQSWIDGGMRRDMAYATDGTSSTLLAGETRIHLAYIDSGGCCGDNENAYTGGPHDDVTRSAGKAPNVPQPDVKDAAIADTTVDGMFGSSHTAGMNAVLIDGSVQFINYNIDSVTFGNLCDGRDGKTFTLD